MDILVVGSKGFIGSYVAAESIARGYSVTGCDLVEDVSSSYPYQKISVLSADFDALFSSQHFDVCVNASGSGNVSFSIAHPLNDFEANALAVIKVLDTIRKYNPACRYVHISSAAVYGNPVRLPIMEEDALSPMSPYGYHKWISEIVCREYFHLYRLPIAIVRPFSVYGAGLKKQLLWDICQKLRQQDSISLFGTGQETRDFIHVKDLVSLIHAIIDAGKFENDIFNAASGTETSIGSIADIFGQCYNGKKHIGFSGNVRAGDPLNWRADISRATSVGFTPVVQLGEGIQEYVTWFESNCD
jgi:UDP-glucose 4-epimerase